MLCRNCAKSSPEVRGGVDQPYSNINYIIILYTNTPGGHSAVGGGPKLTLIVIYYIILYYTEFGGVSEKGVKLVLGDPETPKHLIR